MQYAKNESTAQPVDAKTKKFIQQVCGKFLFLGQAVDSTLLCPISAIASQVASPTNDALKPQLSSNARGGGTDITRQRNGIGGAQRRQLSK